MQSIPAKSDSTAGSTGVLPASEYNDRNVEIEKVITKSGQSLSGAITDQFSKAIFINAIGAASMIDSGSGNTITLNPVTGGGGLVPPDSYTDFNGGVVCFNKATANIGTAVTIAPWGLTAKPLVRKDGSLPLAGDVIGECFTKWDNSADKWVLMRNETDTYKHFIDSSITFTPVFGKTLLEIDTTLGNRIVPISDGVFVGQEIDVYTGGSGKSSFSGTGLYVNNIEQTSNTGILKIEWTGSEWRADNKVTADYVSGVFQIEYTSIGDLIQTVTANSGSILLNPQAGSTFFAGATYPVPFVSVSKSYSHSTGTVLNFTTGNMKPINILLDTGSVFAVNITNITATGTVLLRYTREGKY
jgi:hypothetical protein